MVLILFIITTTIILIIKLSKISKQIFLEWRWYLEPGVVESFINCDPFSRVQHQHTTHQVFGTLWNVAPLPRVHLQRKRIDKWTNPDPLIPLFLQNGDGARINVQNLPTFLLTMMTLGTNYLNFSLFFTKSSSEDLEYWFIL